MVEKNNKTLSFKLKKQEQNVLEVDVLFDTRVVLKQQKIRIKPRYVLAIEDWIQPSKQRPFSRVLLANYKQEIDEIYKELPQIVKNEIVEEKFYKELLKKVQSKEDRKKYKTIRFAFRKENGQVKLFTFYNPYKPCSVISMLGSYMPILKAWYVIDFGDHLVKSGQMSQEMVDKLGYNSQSLRATDEASYFELEEMNYVVLIKEVNEDEIKNHAVELINQQINEALNEDEVKAIHFDIKEYRSIGGFDKYGDSFVKPFVIAFDEAL